MLKYEGLKDWKYRVLETFTHQTDIIPPKEAKTKFSTLSINGLITVDKGFCWDGASGALDTENTLFPSLIHDIGCNMYLLELVSDENRLQFDDLFYKLLKDEGMSSFRASYMYKAVKVNTRARYNI